MPQLPLPCSQTPTLSGVAVPRVPDNQFTAPSAAGLYRFCPALQLLLKEQDTVVVVGGAGCPGGLGISLGRGDILLPPSPRQGMFSLLRQELEGAG